MTVSVSAGLTRAHLPAVVPSSSFIGAAGGAEQVQRRRIASLEEATSARLPAGEASITPAAETA